MKAKRIERGDVPLHENPDYRDDRQQTLAQLMLSGKRNQHQDILATFRKWDEHLLTKEAIARLLVTKPDRIGPFVDDLAAWGLIHCPRGPNNGWAMTTICRRIVDRLLKQGEELARNAGEKPG